MQIQSKAVRLFPKNVVERYFQGFWRAYRSVFGSNCMYGKNLLGWVLYPYLVFSRFQLLWLQSFSELNRKNEEENACARRERGKSCLHWQFSQLFCTQFSLKKKILFLFGTLMPNPLQTQSQEMQVFFVKIGRKFWGKRRLGRPPNFGKGIIKSATRYDKVPLSQFLLLPREDDEESLLVNLF